MSLAPYGTVIAVSLHILVELALIVRVLLRPHRQPASRIAWIVVITVLPVFGILAYLLFGEVNIGRRRVARLRQVIGAMPSFPPAVHGDETNLEANVPERYAHLFHMGRSISGLGPVGGNSARLMADSNSAIDAMVADIDAAEHHVHAIIERALMLVDHHLEMAGIKLKANLGLAFQGNIILGDGFLVDDAFVERELESDAQYSKVLYPYLIGREINQNPDHCPHTSL